MQNGFVNDLSAAVVPVIVNLAERWRTAGGTVVATRFLNADDSNWERLLDWHRFKDSPEVDLVPEVAALDPVVVDKHTYSSLTDQFVTMQETNGWETLVLCGIDTNACVLKTAVDAFERGLTPVVVEDACASHKGKQAHDAGVLVIQGFIGDRQVVATKDLQLD